MEYDVLVVEPIYNIIINGEICGSFFYNRRNINFTSRHAARIFNTDINYVSFKLVGAELRKYHHFFLPDYSNTVSDLPF